MKQLLIGIALSLPVAAVAEDVGTQGQRIKSAGIMRD